MRTSGIIAAVATQPRLRVLLVDADAATTDAAALPVMAGIALEAGPASRSREHDVLLFAAPGLKALHDLAARPGLAELAYDQAVVAATAESDEEAEAELLRLGVEAIAPLPHDDAAALARALRHAYQRKQIERAARTAYATDLATGLPHQAQLLEHMNHLLALRERERAPLVLIALSIDGVAQAAQRLGGEAANVLRRKVAVRLRGGLRASDVVASLGVDLFAVMLGRVDMVGDAEGVAVKLLRALRQPFAVAGTPCHLEASYGLASFPEHGRDAKVLLQRAVAQAGTLGTVGEQGVVHADRRVVPLHGGAAANDEGG
jgi:diguanylate cyclase (GGDEF)-like protein